MDITWDRSSEIVRLSRLCMLPKFARDYNEIENYSEYFDRQNKLEKYFTEIIDMIVENEIKELEGCCTKIIPSLFILYHQRSSDCLWNQPKCKVLAENLNSNFKAKYSVGLDEVLTADDSFNVQEIFDGILQELNKRLNLEDLKKYPAMIVVYTVLLKNIQEYKVILNPVNVFSISLLLIDDYVAANKIRGLKCCITLMDCLEEKHFQNGNYYEVLFGSLKKALSEKDLKITKLVHEALLKFIDIIPKDAKKHKTDDIFALMLEQLHLESNLHRKTVCISFIKNIIAKHKVDCANRKLMKTILYDNIIICCNDAVADILLVDVLECFQVWVVHCWCVWRLSSDHKLLSALIKLLYVNRKEKIASEIQALIVSLITLCSQDERTMILQNLEQSKVAAVEFNEKLDAIKRDIVI